MDRTTGPKWANVRTFFVATYALAWLIWLPAIIWRGEQPNLLLVVLGAFVPSILGIVFTYLTQDRAGRRDFWIRVIDPRRIGWRWLAVIALVFPIAHLLTYLVYTFLGGTPPSLASIGETLTSPGLMIQIILANLIISGFSEELGWRGFALDKLQQRWSALTSSLLLGLVHALWHLPLFFIPGITQGNMGLFSLGALVFLVSVTAGAIIHTWIYNSTRQSILSAILIHFMTNLCLDVLVGLQGALPTGYFAVYAGFIILLDLAIVVVCGAKTLTAQRRSRASHESASA